MSDALKKLGDDLDRARTAPQRLQRLRRGEAYARHICVQCRRVPDEAAMAEYQARYRTATEVERDEMQFPRLHTGPNCPHCGGKLVEVVA